MIAFDPLMNDTDVENFADETKNFDAGLDLLDSMSAGFEEGWQAGPTAAILNYAQSKAGEANLTGEDANKKYGLADTPAAFRPEDKVSDEHAKLVLRRHLERSSNESIAQKVSEDFGAIGHISNFAGSMGAGFVDPINIATGVGTSMAVNKMGFVAARQIFADSALKTSSAAVFGKNLGENFVASLIVDAAIVPIGEEAINQKVGIEQRMFNVLGSTFLGGIMSTGPELAALRKARVAAYHSTKQHGSKAVESTQASLEKQAMDRENGIKPDPDHPVRMSDMEHYNTRPDQTDYAYTDVDSTNVKEQTWVIGRDTNSPDLDQVEIHGDGTVTLVDNHNLVHNRVSPLFKEGAGETAQLKLNKDLKILTNDEFPAVKSSIRESVKEVFDKLPGVNKKTRATFLQQLNEAMQEAESIMDFKDYMHDIVDDFNGIPSIDDMVNVAIRKTGYDGYHFTGSATTMDTNMYNGVTLFKPESFEPGYKGKKSLYVGKGKPAAKGANLTTGDKLFYNKKLFSEVYDSEATVKFDQEHPGAEGFMKPFKDMESAEVNRRNDPSQKIGYDEGAVKELDKNGGDPKVYNSTEELLKEDALEVEQLKKQKDLDDETKRALDVAENPNKISDAANAYIKCRGF